MCVTAELVWQQDDRVRHHNHQCAILRHRHWVVWQQAGTHPGDWNQYILLWYLLVFCVNSQKKKSSKLSVLASAKFLLNFESWFLLCSLLSLKVLVPALQEGVCLGTNQRLEDLVLDWELPLEQVLRVRNKMLLDSLLSDANSVI